jgi:DNA-binding MarR family transcriptional regulator
VSIGQVKALVHLAEYGPQSMSELAAGLQVTTPSATGLVNPLVKTGYVVRQRESDDRRLVTVRLSETARVFADRILAVRRAQVENALAGMDVDARAHVLEGLSRLAQDCREEERSE